MDGTILLTELPSPSFVVNRRRVLANCQRMLSYCKAHSVVLRPHMKTHKCVEVARMMTEGVENRPITVSTVAEAELFAKNGFKDILFAHYAVDKTKIARLHALMLAPINALVHVFVDSESGLEVLEKSPPPTESGKWSVYLKIDCGYGRGGIGFDQEATLQLAKKIAHGGATSLHGLYAHDGNSYNAKNANDAVEVGRLTGARLAELAGKISIDRLAVAIGSTPSCFSYSSCDFALPPGVTELHPGAYAFCDTQQACAIGACDVNDIACYVVTRVVGHYPSKGHMLVDAGFTALSHDLGRIDDNDGDDGVTTPRLSVRIVGHPELVVVRVTQEVGIIRARNQTRQPLDFSKYPVGSVLFIQPYHCCATADKYAEYVVTDDDVTAIEKWSPVKGW